MQWEYWAFATAAKQPLREAEHAAPSSAVMKTLQPSLFHFPLCSYDIVFNYAQEQIYLSKNVENVYVYTGKTIFEFLRHNGLCSSSYVSAENQH